MSAIAGIYHSNKEPVPIEHSRGIMKALQKYPADDVQAWCKQNIFLGCHAQWITPESVGEKLPYHDYESKITITADAIIDNRKELFEKLQVERGYQKQMTDSELILRAYQKWGEASPKYLVGDFAYMIWDEREQKLFGARDFSGSRTLYYYHDGQRFAFCTVIRPLLTLPFIKKELNEEWLAQYLAISGAVDAVNASITPYKKVGQIPPSHSISVIRDKVTHIRYCSLTPGKQLKLKSDQEYVEAFKEIFQDSVESRLRTNRGVGAHLSGGLDSGSVVAFAGKALRKENKQLHTFSYIPSKDFKDFTQRNLLPDERPYIKSTVEHVGGISDHYLDFSGKNSFSEVDDLLEMLEMPYKFFENSFWLKGIFEKAHEKDMGVLLNGARGNLSISWGSALEYYAVLLKKFNWIRLFQELDQYSKNVGGPRLRRIPVIARMTYPFINKLFPTATRRRMPVIINREFAKRTGVFNELKGYGIDQSGWFKTRDMYKQRKRHFQDVFHWNATNTLGSKLSLRYNLWERDPTNDLRIIQFCLSLPEDQYVQNGLDRALIRRATEEYLPSKVRLNQRIRGVQGVDWVHRMIPFWNSFTDELKQLSKDKRALEFLDEEAINTALLKIENGARSEDATNSDYRVSMRSLIVYRFIKEFA